MRGDAVAPPELNARHAGDATNPLSQLRPLGPGAVLDGAVELLRHRFGRIMALAASLYIPIWLLNVAVTVIDPSALGSGEAGSGIVWSPVGASTSESAWVWMIGLLQVVALSILGLVIGRLATALAEGNDPSFGELVGFGARRSWVAVLVVPMNMVVHTSAACMGGFTWMLGDALVFIVSVAAGAEGSGPVSAFRRSIQLTSSQYGRSLVLCTSALVLSWVIRLSFSAGPTMLIASLDPTSSLVGLVGALSSAVTLLTEPLTACIAARSYLDLRCRRDGYDLELRRARLGLA